MPPTPPSLVKLDASASSLSSGAASLDAHQRPGAGADVRPAHRPRAGTAATAAAVSCVAGAITGAGVQPRLRRPRVRPQRPQHRARRHDRARDALRQAERRTRPSAQRPRRRVEHLAGAGVGEFVDLDAGEEVVEQVRHEQQRLGRVQQRRAVALQGQQLEQRVEAHELDAGLPEELLARHPGEGRFHDAFGVRIAVVARVAEQRSRRGRAGRNRRPRCRRRRESTPPCSAAQLRSAGSISPCSRSTSQCSVSRVRTGRWGSGA